MSAQSEEDDRIDALLADADWCKSCDRPIGLGSCGGCIAVACCDEDLDFYRDYDDE